MLSISDSSSFLSASFPSSYSSSSDSSECSTSSLSSGVSWSFGAKNLAPNRFFCKNNVNKDVFNASRNYSRIIELMIQILQCWKGDF